MESRPVAAYLEDVDASEDAAAAIAEMMASLGPRSTLPPSTLSAGHTAFIFQRAIGVLRAQKRPVIQYLLLAAQARNTPVVEAVLAMLPTSPALMSVLQRQALKDALFHAVYPPPASSPIVRLLLTKGGGELDFARLRPDCVPIVDVFGGKAQLSLLDAAVMGRDHRLMGVLLAHAPTAASIASGALTLSRLPTVASLSASPRKSLSTTAAHPLVVAARNGDTTTAESILAPFAMPKASHNDKRLVVQAAACAFDHGHYTTTKFFLEFTACHFLRRVAPPGARCADIHSLCGSDSGELARCLFISILSGCDSFARFALDALVYDRAQRRDEPHMTKHAPRQPHAFPSPIILGSNGRLASDGAPSAMDETLFTPLDLALSINEFEVAETLFKADRQQAGQCTISHQCFAMAENVWAPFLAYLQDCGAATAAASPVKLDALVAANVALRQRGACEPTDFHGEYLKDALAPAAPSPSPSMASPQSIVSASPRNMTPRAPSMEFVSPVTDRGHTPAANVQLSPSTPHVTPQTVNAPTNSAYDQYRPKLDASSQRKSQQRPADVDVSPYTAPPADALTGPPDSPVVDVFPTDSEVFSELVSPATPPPHLAVPFRDTPAPQAQPQNYASPPPRAVSHHPIGANSPMQPVGGGAVSSPQLATFQPLLQQSAAPPQPLHSSSSYGQVVNNPTQAPTPQRNSLQPLTANSSSQPVPSYAKPPGGTLALKRNDIRGPSGAILSKSSQQQQAYAPQMQRPPMAASLSQHHTPPLAASNVRPQPQVGYQPPRGVAPPRGGPQYRAAPNMVPAGGMGGSTSSAPVFSIRGVNR